MGKTAQFAILADIELHWKPNERYSLAETQEAYSNGVYTINDTPEEIGSIFDTYQEKLKEVFYKNRPEKFATYNLSITMKVRQIARLG